MGVSCSVPFPLSNGTTADATQVMANFNALLACLANAATAGINSDITQLTGLVTPLSPGLGGATIFLGGTSTGAANAQVVGTTTPNSFTLTSGYRATFIAGFTNTAAMTLNVRSTGVTQVFRKTQLGISNTVGGEIIAGHPVSVVYDGTRFVIDGEIRRVGEVRDFCGSAAPPGAFFGNGAAVSRTTFADLFTVIGTTFGVGDGSTTFNLPDYRGRVGAGNDVMGASAANRIGTVVTDSGTITGSTTGSNGGSSTHILTTGEMPTHNHGITEPNAGAGHNHAASSGSGFLGSGGTGNASGGSGGALVQTANAVTGITINNNGSSTAHALLQPTLIVNKIIYF